LPGRLKRGGGKLIMSVPKKSCETYRDSEIMDGGFRIIKRDPYNIRIGDILKVFEGEDEIKQIFGGYFENFIFTSLEDDCFGWSSHYHLVVCDKKF